MVYLDEFLVFTHLLIVTSKIILNYRQASVRKKIIFLSYERRKITFFCFRVSLVSIIKVCFHLDMWNSTTGINIRHIKILVYTLVHSHCRP